MKKKEIIFLLPDLETGGAERIVTILANHLDREKFTPKIMLLRKKGGYLEHLKTDIEIIPLNINRIRYSIFSILKEIKKRKPDILFSGFGEVNAYLSVFIPFFKKTKFIARETNVVSEHITRPEIKFFYKFYNHFHQIICQSDDMAKDLIQNFKIKKEKIVKINNPVDFQFIEHQLSLKQNPNEHFSMEEKNVVAIGNLSHRKGFDLLLEVFQHLKNEKIKLHIIGDGDDREKLLDLKEKLNLNQVIFHGKQKNPFEFLKFADLFILSSRYEGFPNVLLEAGSCGVYALANGCPGGINEIIEENINGEIFDIRDSKKASEQIKKAIYKTHDKTQIKNSIKNRFSKEIILKKYEYLLLKI